MFRRLMLLFPFALLTKPAKFYNLLMSKKPRNRKKVSIPSSKYFYKNVSGGHSFRREEYARSWRAKKWGHLSWAALASATPIVDATLWFSSRDLHQPSRIHLLEQLFQSRITFDCSAWEEKGISHFSGIRKCIKDNNSNNDGLTTNRIPRFCPYLSRYSGEEFRWWVILKQNGTTGGLRIAGSPSSSNDVPITKSSVK